MSTLFALRAQSRMCVSGVKLSESRMVCRGRKRIQTLPAPEKKSIDLLPRPLHLTCPIPHAAPVKPHCSVTKHACRHQFLFRTLAQSPHCFFLSLTPVASRRQGKGSRSLLFGEETHFPPWNWRLVVFAPVSATWHSLGVKPILSLTECGLMKLFSTSLLPLSAKLDAISLQTLGWG